VIQQQRRRRVEGIINFDASWELESAMKGPPKFLAGMAAACRKHETGKTLPEGLLPYVEAAGGPAKWINSVDKRLSRFCASWKNRESCPRRSRLTTGCCEE
jgi:hypothetical protein